MKNLISHGQKFKGVSEDGYVIFRVEIFLGEDSQDTLTDGLGRQEIFGKAFVLLGVHLEKLGEGLVIKSG